MALISVISGAYVGLYAATDGAAGVTDQGLPLGVTKDGYALAWKMHEKEWRRSVSFGDTLIETVYVGADWTITSQFREWARSAVVNALWPWGNDLHSIPVDTRFNVGLGDCGRRGTEHAGRLILTATAGTPAAGNPATFTAQRALAQGNQEAGWKFDSTVREGPTRFRLLPFDVQAPDPDALPIGVGVRQTWFQTT